MAQIFGGNNITFKMCFFHYYLQITKELGKCSADFVNDEACQDTLASDSNDDIEDDVDTGFLLLQPQYNFSPKNQG